MTERAAGADATGMQTAAVRDGDNWILNGEKWFSSMASISDMAVIVAKTNPEAPRHQQFSQFIVPLPESRLSDSPQYSRDDLRPS